MQFNCFDKYKILLNLETLIINLNKEFMKDYSSFFSKEQRDEILACCFILKADSFGNTSLIANQVKLFINVRFGEIMLIISQNT